MKGKTLQELIERIGPRQTARGKIVFTNGCFDLLHVGHVRLLQQARALGDVLVVAINSDRSVRELKGPSRPILNQDERVEILSALEAVTYVTIFDEPDPWGVVDKIRPHVLIKGADWGGFIIGRDIVEGDGGEVISLPMVPGFSTSALIERIIKGCKDDPSGDIV